MCLLGINPPFFLFPFQRLGSVKDVSICAIFFPFLSIFQNEKLNVSLNNLGKSICAPAYRDSNFAEDEVKMPI